MPLLSDLVEVTEAEVADSLPVIDMTSVTASGADEMCEVEVEVLEESAILQGGGGLGSSVGSAVFDESCVIRVLRTGSGDI